MMLGPIWSSAVQYSTEIHLSSFSVKVFQGKGSDDKRTGTYRTRSVDWFQTSNPHDSLLSLPLHSSTFLPFPPLPSFALPVTAVMWQSYPVVRTWTEWEVSDGPDQGWLSRVLPNVRKKRKGSWLARQGVKPLVSHSTEMEQKWQTVTLIVWLTDWLIDRLIHGLIDSLTDLLTDSLTDWLSNKVIQWRTYWLTDRLTTFDSHSTQQVSPVSFYTIYPDQLSSAQHNIVALEVNQIVSHAWHYIEYSRRSDHQIKQRDQIGPDQTRSDRF